ncbi:MAG: ParB/RepB/Spo0J family partition protein, partial [Planctomycetota bacterium]
GDEKAAELALIENLQREDLNAIEKAEAFQHLGDQFGLSHSQIAERVGLERSSISNLLRLLDLSNFVRDLVSQNVLSMGQARAIAGLSDAAQQRALAERAVREGLSVRQVEQEARRLQQPSATQGVKLPGTASPVLSDLEKQIGQQLGTRVKIKAGRKKGAGTLAIDFYSLDEFDALLARLDVKAD